MKSNLQFQTYRLLLKKFEGNDLSKVYKGLSHPYVIKYYEVSYSSLENTKIQMDWFEELEKQERVFGEQSVPGTIRFFTEQ